MFREASGILATLLLVADFHRTGQWPTPANVKKAIDGAKLFAGELIKREPELRKFEDELQELRRKADEEEFKRRVDNIGTKPVGTGG